MNSADKKGEKDTTKKQGKLAKSAQIGREDSLSSLSLHGSKGSVKSEE